MAKNYHGDADGDADGDAGPSLNGYTGENLDLDASSEKQSPSTHLPTLVNGPLNTLLALSHSASFPSFHTLPEAEKENDVIVSWATLLHLYTVSDHVCFTVSGRSQGTSDRSRASQRVVSRWLHPRLQQNAQPQLHFEPYMASEHNQVPNTHVQFSRDESIWRGPDYVLEWDPSQSQDVRLHTNPSTVPPTFASALWNTLLEIHDGIRTKKPYTSSLSASDYRAIREEFPAALFEERLCLHQLFHESVRLAPRAEAVAAWDGSLSYEELDELSDSLAVQLVQEAQLRPGQYVPFSFEKSMWMVVAVLGILKAGGAIVPIDPSQPDGRALEILNEIDAAVVVTSPKQAPRFANTVPKVVQVAPETVRATPHHKLSRIPLPAVRLHQPAMVIFTSGSTGKPKGIVIPHSASSTRTIIEGKTLGYQDKRVLQFAASTWDIFMTDIFTTLAFQGCICIPSEEQRRFNLANFCTEKNVTLALITPSLAGLLDPSTFPTLRTLIFGGEALRKDVAEKWMRAKDIQLLQGYGPAETGFIIGTSVKGIKYTERPEIIGYARGNSVCVLVDPNDHDRLVPRGAVGELVVGGPTLFHEYLNNPEKTQLAVIQNPSWAKSLDVGIKRFYKTGDLLHQSLDLLDGRLEFVGRTDDQVKYHGQRIELKEIEHHLRNLPGGGRSISACVVTLPKSGRFKDKLVAVVQCDTSDGEFGGDGLSIRNDNPLDLATVKRLLSTALPAYMIPSELLVVDKIPHNSALKLDRSRVNRWVTELGLDQFQTESHLAIDRDTLLTHESTASVISGEYARLVSGEDDARRRDYEGYNFNLQAGGIDSIQIISLSMFISRRYGVQVPMEDMLSSKATIRSVAAVVDAKNTGQYASRQTGVSSIEDEIEHQFQSIRVPSIEAKVKRVFLTGATGFLGMDLLRQLLHDSNYHVYALVRASTEKEATDRLIQKATEAGWWKGHHSTRLHVLKGDLTQPQLGLTDAHLSMLQGRSSPSIDAIIHNGARVHYNLDYHSLKPANVTATAELLKIVNERLKPLDSFVYVSGGQQLGFKEADDETNVTNALNGSGYSRSKAISEILVKRFASESSSKAKHIRVVKPGFIMGNADHGVANHTDFIWRLVSACVEIGCYNEDEMESWLFLSDITHVSGTILQSVVSEDTTQTFKILDGLRFKHLWELLRESFGYHLRPLSQKEWLARLRQSVAIKQEAHVMFPLMYMLDDDKQTIGVRDGPTQPSAGVVVAVEANVRYLLKNRYLPQPSAVATPTSSQDTSASEEDVFDVQSAREEFPALHQGVVAFNNAAGTVLHKDAIEGTREYMNAFPYELGRDDAQSQEKTQRLMSTYAELAAFMNADPDEVAFGQTTTFLLRMLGQALKPNLNSDCEIIVSNLCHEASAAAWVALAKDLGIAIKWWAPPPGDDPCLSVETLKPLLTSKTRIVTCNHVSNVVGTIHPIRQVADLVHTIPGAIVIVDGVAYAPHRPVDVKAFDVDFYCFSWYKVFGPHVAQLYGRRSVQKRMLQGISHFFLGDMPGLDWRLRLGANSFELEAALVPITRYLKRVGWENIIAQETLLQEVLLAHLRRRPDVFRVFGEKSSSSTKRVPVITFCVAGRSCLDVTNKICQAGRFRVVSGNCWAPRPTHDVLGLDEDGLIRVSFVHYNTVSEVKEFCQVLDSVVDGL